MTVPSINIIEIGPISSKKGQVSSGESSSTGFSSLLAGNDSLNNGAENTISGKNDAQGLTPAKTKQSLDPAATSLAAQNQQVATAQITANQKAPETTMAPTGATSNLLPKANGPALEIPAVPSITVTAQTPDQALLANLLPKANNGPALETPAVLREPILRTNTSLGMPSRIAENVVPVGLPIGLETDGIEIPINTIINSAANTSGAAARQMRATAMTGGNSAAAPIPEIVSLNGPETTRLLASQLANHADTDDPIRVNSLRTAGNDLSTLNNGASKNNLLSAPTPNNSSPNGLGFLQTLTTAANTIDDTQISLRPATLGMKPAGTFQSETTTTPKPTNLVSTLSNESTATVLGINNTADNGNISTIAKTSRPATPQPQVPLPEQIAVHIARAVGDGVNRIHVQLQPAEMGRVEINLDLSRDGRVVATVVADRQDTLDNLQRDSRSLERALQQAGLQTDSQSLNFGLRGEQKGHLNPEKQGSPSGSAAEENLPIESVAGSIISQSRPVGLPNGALDISV